MGSLVLTPEPVQFPPQGWGEAHPEQMGVVAVKPCSPQWSPTNWDTLECFFLNHSKKEFVSAIYISNMCSL